MKIILENYCTNSQSRAPTAVIFRTIFARNLPNKQVQVRLVGATNLTTPSASIFATFSYRGTKLSKTSIVRPAQQKTPSDDGGGGGERATTSKASDGFSHAWLTPRDDSTCTVPLPEGSVDRRETEIEIDLWEEGGPEKEHGDHLGQVSSAEPHGTAEPTRLCS